MKNLLALAALLAWGVMGVAAEQPPASSELAQSPSSLSGTLTAKGGTFFLTDEATGSTVEVHGKGLLKYAGKKVNVVGKLSPGAEGAPDILTISEVSRAVAVSGKAAAAGVKSGLSKAAVLGIAGAGTAATVGTLYGADVIGGEDTAVSRK